MANRDDEEVPLTNVRPGLITERLTESEQTPHFYVTTVVDGDRLLALRADINEAVDPEGSKPIGIRMAVGRPQGAP